MKSHPRDNKLLDPKKLEKLIYKQQFLEKNCLFNPTRYFGGVEVSTFENHLLDQRLNEMFTEYLPTEIEEDLNDGLVIILYFN